MDDEVRHALRSLPAIEELLNRPEASRLLSRYARTRVADALRHVLAVERRRLLEGRAPDETPERRAGTALGSVSDGAAVSVAAPPAIAARADGRPAGPPVEDLIGRAESFLQTSEAPSLRRVLNLTGVVLHTNLGRSRLAPTAIERVSEVAASYSNLEYDLETGTRGNREARIEQLLATITGAEAAAVVNNNAGAVMLLLMGIAARRQVVVSRGQLVEIGGSFRLPEILAASGAKLVEVGTTNRTRLTDYASAISQKTGLLLRVHTSNYRVLGFTEEVSLEELVKLGHDRGIPVADDLGSGALADLPVFAGEPSVRGSLAAGADAVCFSGDKLLGGPQAGIVVGRRDIVARLKKHPAARALRLDKMSLAALEATLVLYLDPVKASREIPTLRFLSRTAADTEALATRLAAGIAESLARSGQAAAVPEVVATVAQAGGGTLPLRELPSHAVCLRPQLAAGISGDAMAGGAGGARTRIKAEPPFTARDLEQALRRSPVPVVARISEEAVLLDVLALAEDELELAAQMIVLALETLAARQPGPAAHNQQPSPDTTARPAPAARRRAAGRKEP